MCTIINRSQNNDNFDRTVTRRQKASRSQSIIMRAKKNLPKKETVRLVDDVTKHNMGLITRLRNCKELESAWYFNCSVYGKTFDEKRIKFDIFDDINNKIAKRH